MSDLIDRQAAIEALAKFVPYAICDESTESYTNGLTDAYNLICQLPSAQPEEVTPHRNYQYLSDYWCECGWHLGKMGDVNYCPNCGKKVKWDG